MVCNGDPNQLCGGTWRMNIYGPPPLAGSATQHNGVVQECKPWCQTQDNNGGEVYSLLLIDNFS